MKRSLALLCSGFLAHGLFAADAAGPANRVRLADPNWAVALRGGAVMPLGELAQFNQVGPSAALDLYYHASATNSVCGFLGYSTQGYKVGGGSLPLSNASLGVKLLHTLAEVEDATWYGGGGVALIYNQRTKQILRPVTSNAPPIFDPVPDSSFGFGVLAVLGGRYQASGGWGLLVELNLISINLAGGTSDNLLLVQPMVGLSHAL